MSEPLSKAYEPQEVEKKWYSIWLEAELFVANSSDQKPPYTIVMPPPNITGSLHMGHALYTLQDILIRWRRMQGYNALWLPGTDHAGISTQVMVERDLKKQGLSRHQVGREKFTEKVWEWKAKHGSRIEEQLKVLGFSCDWSRNNFTMSEKLNRAVREVFVRLYEEGLIYRDERLINWCPSCQTVLSDLEVDHEEGVKGSLWHLRYPVHGQPGRYLVVATTRPETMLGDTAVAVHSNDKRYQDLHGANLDLPLTGRTISVIVDDILVDPEFGSGAVKVTPGHDFNDFQVGKRHQLPMLSVLDTQARIQLPDSPFDGLDRFEARKAIVETLQQQGLLSHIEDHTLSLARCDRCATIVEPTLSPQWYVKMAPLAEPALQAVRNKETVIIPEHWTKTYEHWMTNIQDWCVSRQLWWGHQIPAWYCAYCNRDTLHKNAQGEITISRQATPVVSREAPKQCSVCGHDEWIQDPDVLDTWFSSGLWPFSTLGWPDDTPDLHTFYPNSVMETGSDILFFWVARMMMMGIHFMKAPPFSKVYLHAMVRDEHGQKMSKTKGNVIDPLDMVDGVPQNQLERLPKSQRALFPQGTPAFGADALRFTLAAASVAGRDIKLNLEQLQGYRAFCNKIWNASRFALMNLEDYKPDRKVQSDELAIFDRWILSRLSNAITTVYAQLENFAFAEASLSVYHFFWNEFCDWYLELSKSQLRGDAVLPAQRHATQMVLARVLDQSLRLIHPFMPFITEEIWQKLPRVNNDEKFLMTAAVAKNDDWVKEDRVAEIQVSLLIDALTALRNIRGEAQLAPSKVLPAELHAEQEILTVLEFFKPQIERLAQIHPLSLRVTGSIKPPQAAVSVVNKIEGVISLVGLIDIAKESERIEKEIMKITTEQKKIYAKLDNTDFLARAPAEVIETQRQRANEFSAQLDKLQAHLLSLKEKELLRNP